MRGPTGEALRSGTLGWNVDLEPASRGDLAPEMATWEARAAQVGYDAFWKQRRETERVKAQLTAEREAKER